MARPGDRAGGRAADTALLDVRDLRVSFPVLRGLLRRSVGSVRAVDGVSFEVRSGETLGVVGESGSGKSTMARAILQLVRPRAGRVVFDGRELTSIGPDELRVVRRDLQMVFQDPYASLNPRMRAATIVAEPLDVHGLDRHEGAVTELLERVGLDRHSGRRFPRELSGGQRQRVAIARALATRPKLVVADEPISALDVSIQAQIVNLLAELKAELGLTYVFIAHDLSMVRHISDRVAVMYLGRIVEVGERDAVFSGPLHPYTRALVDAIPVADPSRRPADRRPVLGGEIPSAMNPPSGCRFRTRCAFATDLCAERDPVLRVPDPAPGALSDAASDAATAVVVAPGVADAAPRQSDAKPSHRVACHHAEEISGP